MITKILIWILLQNSRQSLVELINASDQDRIVRHSDKANVTFLDGHARARTYNFFLGKDASHTFLDPLQ